MFARNKPSAHFFRTAPLPVLPQVVIKYFFASLDVNPIAIASITSVNENLVSCICTSTKPLHAFCANMAIQDQIVYLVYWENARSEALLRIFFKPLQLKHLTVFIV